MDMDEDLYEFSPARAATIMNILELERICVRDSVLLLSRSSVLASDEVDFKQNLETVAHLRERVDRSLPYLYAGLGGKSVAEVEREELARKYMERAIKVLGEDKVKELIANGKL